MTSFKGLKEEHKRESMRTTALIEQHPIKRRSIPIDNGSISCESEHPRLGVPLLRFGCDCANFNKAESHLVEPVHSLAVLVKACRNPDGVFEL